MIARRIGGAAVAALLFVLTGCSGAGATATEVTGPFRACTFVDPSASAQSAGSAGSAGPSGSAQSAGSAGPAGGVLDVAMATITLPCFAGGPEIDLARIGRPAVLNLWGSWCGPCRAELPRFQAFADKAGSAVAVLGVVTGDTRSAAASFAEDTGVTFPAVFDPDSKVQHSGLVPVGLPTTLFVDAQGRVRHIESGPVKDLSTLESLAREYLAVPL